MLSKLYRSLQDSNLNRIRNGFKQLSRTGKTPEAAHRALRELYVSTNGRSNDMISRLISFRHRAKKTEELSQLFAPDEESAAVRGLESDGYYVFNSRLPAEILESLQKFGRSQPCRALENTDPEKLDFQTSEEVPYNPATQSPKFSFTAQSLAGSSTIQQLMMDAGFRRIAERYLWAPPILDVLTMWWSQPCGAAAHTSAAQLYHFDMDRVRFVKFFFYLTDVTPETGPHCYVRGSARRKPKSVLRDGRIPDEDIEKAFAPEDLVELCGSAGTIIAADTRGFHKGKMLTEGNRLLLQFEMANSMFGASYPQVPFDPQWEEGFKQFVSANRRFCSMFESPERC